MAEFMGVCERCWDSLAAIDIGEGFEYDDTGRFEFYAVVTPEGGHRVEFEDYDTLLEKGWIVVDGDTLAISQTGEYWLARFRSWYKKQRRNSEQR